MKKIYSIYFLMAPLVAGMAQYSEQIDSTRILSYADKFVVKINFDTQTDVYTLKNNEDNDRLTIAPNNNYRLFVSLDYEFFGLSIGFAPTFIPWNNDDDLKGESSFSDFKFRAAIGPWIQGFQVGRIKGYYVENTGDFVPGWQEGVEPYFQIPTMTSKIYGMWTSYNFNPNFSFRNILYQTEWQKRSSGSFIPSLYYSYEELSYSLGGLDAKEFACPIRLAPAYFYTMVFRENWFIGGNLSPSIGVRFAKSTFTENNIRSVEKYSAFTHSLEGVLQLGYASKKIIFGAGINFNVNGYTEDKTNAIENDKLYGLLYFGYRINTPGIIERTYHKYAEKLGL